MRKENSSSENSLSANKYVLDTSGHVQLELPVTIVRNMMIDTYLPVEDLHCLNQVSKKVIKRILLDRVSNSLEKYR